MAENPIYASYAERVVCKAIEEYEEMTIDFGPTLAKYIVNQLEAYKIIPRQLRPKHNHFTRDIRPDDCDVCALYYNPLKEPEKLND